MKKISAHSVPALVTATLFATGIVVGEQCDPAVSADIAIIALLAALVLYLRSCSAAFPALLSLSIFTLIVGAGMAKIGFDLAADPQPPGSFLKRPVSVTGKVLDASGTFDNKKRFLLRLESIGDSTLDRQPTVLVTMTRQSKDTSDVPCTYGTIIALRGQLSLPSPDRNPGEFNSRVYYRAQGIGMLMRVRGYSNMIILDSISHGNLYDRMMRDVVLPLRSYMLLSIDTTVGGEEGELLKGICVGDRSGLSSSTKIAFMHSGLTHILAVSGSHVAVVFAFLTIMLGLMRIPRVTRIILTAFVLIVYMMLTGAQPPIVRATIMAIVLIIGKILGEKSNALNALGVAALIILAYDSRQLFDVGFQLSFLAVLSIVYLYPIVQMWISLLPGRGRWRKPVFSILQLAGVSLVATLGTLPVTAISFGKISIVGLLTNVVIIPVIGMSMVLGFVSLLVGWASVFAADAFAAVNFFLLKFSLWATTLSGNLSWAFVETLRFKAVHAIPFYAAMGILFHYHKQHAARIWVIVFLMSLNAWLILSPPVAADTSDGKLRVSFIDVGQGDAAFVEFPDGKTMLIDAGPISETYDAGEQIVAPFLKRRGVSTIDYLVASHPHGDHIGGMPYIFKSFDVREVIESGQPASDPIYGKYIRAIRNEGCAVDTARSLGSVYHVGGATLYALYPTSTFIDRDTTHPHENLNNTSVVLKLCFGSVSVLFTGDAERDAEEEMFGMYGDFLRSSVLKVGHHGSRTSTTNDFLSAVNPSTAIISVGYNNKFNHPSPEVVTRLQSIGAEVLRTDEEGALVFETDGKELWRVEWR